MIKKILILLAACFVVSFWALNVLAQAEKKENKEQKPQLFLVSEVIVKPSKVTEFESAIKDEVALFSKYQVPYPWEVFTTTDFHYYFLFPVENLADVDNISKAFSEAIKKAGEEYKALRERYIGTYEYEHFSTWYLRPDLSYFPETPRLMPKEEKFLHFSFYYIKAGMENEAEQIAKEWKALYKSKNIPDRYHLFVGSIGVDNPVFCVIGSAKSASDFFSQEEKTNELFGEEIFTLSKKTAACLRKFVQKTGFNRPDLSFMSKKEEKPKE